MYPINVLIMSDSRIQPTSLVLFAGKAHATSAAFKRNGIINFRRPLGAVGRILESDILNGCVGFENPTVATSVLNGFNNFSDDLPFEKVV